MAATEEEEEEMNKPTDFQIMCQLIKQVQRARPPGCNERRVTTIITRPMWEAWCRAVEMPTDSVPVNDGPAEQRNSVYGSTTYVVESPRWMCVSGVLPV